MFTERLEEELKQKIQTLKLNDKEKDLLIKEIDVLSDIIVENVQNKRKEN
ncbi:MAG: hypothetical protein PHV76_07825 [Bacteroidales bacterium]|nr:hypothetical protein [Bacteroidales bacterium]